MKKYFLSIVMLAGALCINAQKYSPSWSSLSQWETPEWFKDAKLGMWAHWGFQSNPQAGNWYTRNLYYDDLWQNGFHKEHYGSPADYGVKELLRDWKAENWNPDSIVQFYKSVGAKYFFTLGNFHDNVDLWDSKYQEWNSVNFGPKKDIVGIWSKAAKAAGLPFGISFHAAHAWTYFEGSRKYDGLLQKKDGKGKWWQGYDPQKLYVQNHPLSQNGDHSDAIYGQWDWNNGADQPSKEFKKNFVDRTLDAIKKYNPNLLYFDDNVLPFFYSDSVPGLEIASKFYNKMNNDGQDTGIMLCKGLNSNQQECLTWDIERGIPSTIQKNYWQTCTCLGEWFYSKDRYEKGDYKSAKLVIQMLLDIISKNGNMLLSVPLRGDGTPDDKEIAILNEMKAWLSVNGESIFGTRVWKTFGEGPIADAANPNAGTSFNEGTNYSAKDVRYVQKNGIVYATIMDWPSAQTFTFKAFSPSAETYSGEIKQVELLGYGPVKFTENINGLTVTLPKQRTNPIAPAFKIEFKPSKTDITSKKDVLLKDLKQFTKDIQPDIIGNTGRYDQESYENLLKAIETAQNTADAQKAYDTLVEAWKRLDRGQAIASEAQKEYLFRCTDYISTDDARAPQSAFSYDTKKNTITITADGSNNIAFKMDPNHDNEYYFTQNQQWFTIVADNIKTSAEDNYIWFFNGYRTEGQTPADKIIKLKDGRTMLLWNLKTDNTINKSIDLYRKDIDITANGASFINAIGLTAAQGNKSTIFDINFYAPFEIASHYPEAMEDMGYTPATLEAELKTVSQQTLHKINSTSFKKFAYTTTDEGLHATFDDVYNVYLSFYNDDIVRVYKSFNPDMSVKKSLSVVASPVKLKYNIKDEKDATTIETSKIRIAINHKTGCITAYRSNGEELIIEKDNKWKAKKDGPFDSYTISANFQLADNEEIYGMGQIQDGKLNRRGTSVHLQQLNMKICIPFFQSSKNYSLFWDNYSPTNFSDDSDGTSFASTGTEIDYYIINGNAADQVLANLRHLTGQAKMPPLWTFGLYQSKERYVSADETMGIVKKYRELGVPLDCIVQDWQYWGDGEHWNAMEFLNPQFLNYDEMIRSVHKDNAHLMISIWSNFGSKTEMQKILGDKGLLLPPETYPCGIPGAKAYDAWGKTAQDIYWNKLYNGLVNKGIDAYWMDATEPEYTYSKPSELDFVSEFGRTFRSLHNGFVLGTISGVYNHHYQLAHAGNQYIKDKRASIMTRSGFIGMQRYAAEPWSGDVMSSWKIFADQIPAALNLSACGIPYWNSDIGAFWYNGDYNGVKDPKWRSLYTRWTQFGAFTTKMRFHGSQTPREIYQFGSQGDSIGDYDNILKYIKLRYRLLPYLYSTAWQVTNYDKTFMQALPISFGKDTKCKDVKDEYMFGSAFLVAPVITDSTTRRDVYLPAGNRWVNFWTGKLYDGAQTINTDAPKDILPLYVRAGSILPWGPEVQYSTEKKWDNLEIRVYPGQNGSFTLYEDAFDGYAYENGEYTEIPFVWNDKTSTLTICNRKGEYPEMLKSRTFRIVKVSSHSGRGDTDSQIIHKTINYNGQSVSVKLN